MTERKLFGRFAVGSHLYGTATEGSDHDYLELFYPTLDELVGNKQVRIPQTVVDGNDTRRLLLGDFVMSLGTSPENTTVALHYPEFRELLPFFLVRATAEKFLKVAHDMWTYNPDNGKVRAHAYRYTIIAHWLNSGGMIAGSWVTPFPMWESEVAIYRKIREDPAHLSYMEDVILRRLTDFGLLSTDPINTQALAQWAWNKYKEEYQ